MACGGWSSTGWSRGFRGLVCLAANCPSGLSLCCRPADVAAWRMACGGCPFSGKWPRSRRESQAGESLAMVGVLKPSLHVIQRQVVLYEGLSASGLVNLSDRLGQRNAPRASGRSADELADRAGGDRRLHQPLPYLAKPWCERRLASKRQLPASGGWKRARRIKEAERPCKLRAKPGSLRDPRPERY